MGERVRRAIDLHEVERAGLERETASNRQRVGRVRRTARRQRAAVVDGHRIEHIDGAGSCERTAIAYVNGVGTVDAVQHPTLPELMSARSTFKKPNDDAA